MVVLVVGQFIVRHRHLNVGHTRAVVETYVAGHASCVLTSACLHIGLRVVLTLTVGDGTYLIFIAQQGRYALVLIARIIKVVGNEFPVIVATAFDTAVDLEVVNDAFYVPCQHDAALEGLRHQRLTNLTIAFMVEVVSGQLGVGIGNGVVFFRCRHDGIELRAVQRPTNREELCQFSFRGANQATAHHRQHLVAVHIPSGSQAAGQIAGRQRADVVPQVAVGHLGHSLVTTHYPARAQFLNHL